MGLGKEAGLELCNKTGHLVSSGPPLHQSFCLYRGLATELEVAVGKGKREPRLGKKVAEHGRVYAATCGQQGGTGWVHQLVALDKGDKCVEHTEGAEGDV